jgi:hypothetical protein
MNNWQDGGRAAPPLLKMDAATLAAWVTVIVTLLGVLAALFAVRWTGIY